MRLRLDVGGFLFLWHNTQVIYFIDNKCPAMYVLAGFFFVIIPSGVLYGGMGRQIAL
jgi:hypothetical protein